MPRKLKIAVIHPGVGVSQGGTQTFVLELCQKLEFDFDITILCSKSVNSLCKEIKCIPRRTKPDTYFITRMLSKISSSPDIVLEHITSFFPVLEHLLFEEYDVLFPNNDWGGLFVASIIREIKGTPIIFTEHCGLMENNKIAKRNLKFKPDKYIALSEGFYKWVKLNYSEIDTNFIPNGVDLEKFNVEVKKMEINLPRPIFLVSGRNYANKRLDLAIKAVSKLQKGSLLMLCPDENVQKLKDLGENLLGKDRFLLKSVSYEEIPSYYASCDVFTLPSLNEPFGLVYLEALACGKPVVAPDDKTRRFIIGDAGLFCDVENVDEYAKALQRASMLDAKSFAQKAVGQAEKFSLARTAELYEKEIKSLF